MSDQMLGADLQHLEDSSTAFEQAGAQIGAKADALRDKINVAVEAFVTTLDGLARDATTLTGAIDREIEGVSTQAGGVQWTGGNRDAFDGDLGRLHHRRQGRHHRDQHRHLDA